MGAARQLASPLKAATFETLVGLLACTGLRAGEAMRLDRGDLDAGHALLTVRNSKFNKSRQVLLHNTTVDALRRYGHRRDELCPSPRVPALFLSSTGTRLGHPVLQPTFAGLLRESGVGASAPRGPRVHDLRHSFSVATLLRWYGDGGDVERACRHCRPISATSTPPPLIGTCRPHPSCSERQRTGWRQPSEIRGDAARPDAPGVLPPTG